MTGSAFPSITPTENSRPSIYCSTITSSSYLNASASALLYPLSSMAMPTPTLEPPQHAFTIQGKGTLSSCICPFFKRIPDGAGI